MRRAELFALGIAMLGMAPVAAVDPIRLNARHPDFTLPTIGDGKAVSLSDFRGKKVLLMQFASW